MVTLLFWILAILCCGYAIVFGGKDGAVAATMVMVATVLTAAVTEFRPDWKATNLPVMAVDAMLLLALGVFAFKSRSFWPLWMTAAQLLAVVTHVASLLATGFRQTVYAGLESVWAIPCIGSMVIGITLDRNARRRAAR